MEGSFSSWPLQLDRQVDQDTWYLVWSQLTTGDKLVGYSEESQCYRSSMESEKSFLEWVGGSMCFTHLPDSPLLTVHSSIPYAELMDLV